MPNAGDDVNWAEQLSTLPGPMRAAIVWIRLSGMIAVIMILVGVLVGRDLGFFEDTATRDRRELLKLSADQQRILLQNQSVLNEQLSIMKQHSLNTEAISRNLCMMIPGISQTERQQCMNNDRWR